MAVKRWVIEMAALFLKLLLGLLIYCYNNLTLATATAGCTKSLPTDAKASSTYNSYPAKNALLGSPKVVFWTNQNEGTFPWWQAEIGSCPIAAVNITSRKVGGATAEFIFSSCREIHQ